MNFLSTLLRGISFVPAVITGIEGLFSGRSGADKKEAAVSFISAAIAMRDAITRREILDADKFKAGLSQVIDGTVECLSASAWAKR